MNPIPFMKWRWVAIALSGLAIVTAVASLSLQQLELGPRFYWRYVDRGGL